MAKTIHERLKAAREKAGLSQADLAAKLKIDKTTVSHWELQKALPRRDRLDDVADALGIEIGELRRLYMDAA